MAKNNTRSHSSVVSSEWIDVSVPVRNGMVHWPTDIDIQVEHPNSIERGDDYNLSRMCLGVHSGTHMDAPAHFIKNGKTMRQMPLDIAVGKARVIEIQDSKSIKLAELSAYNIHRGERILFKTKNSARCWQTDKFIEDYVYIAKEAAQFLVDAGVLLIGIDYLSVGGYEVENFETHRLLLGAEIWLLEGLNLSRISPGNYELICLPMKLDECEGAPARAILRAIKKED